MLKPYRKHIVHGIDWDGKSSLFYNYEAIGLLYMDGVKVLLQPFFKIAKGNIGTNICIIFFCTEVRVRTLKKYLVVIYCSYGTLSSRI